MSRSRHSITAWAVLAAAVLAGVVFTPGGAATAAVHRQMASAAPDASAAPGLPPIRHVFVIVLENESASTTFPASGPSPVPYLGDTMRAEGAFLPNYYGTGHESNDNYISMVSGQAPNVDNSTDCQNYVNFPTTATTGPPYHQQEGEGCVYPADIPTIGAQLDAAGLSWRDYNEDMGNIPSRESSTCGHPPVGARDNTQSQVAGDAYATRHDPFVYFHSVIDNTAYCDSHVVNLNVLNQDLKSAASTPNYVYITPNLCHDGHDATCKTPGEDGGLAGIDQFLSTWIPKITHSPAYQDQNGLIITTFDEASGSDGSSCCGEIAGPGEPLPGLFGHGGGRVGAVLLSPCIAPGTVSKTPYNHYAMLGSIENLFGLSHLGYAGLPGENYFGSDVFTRPSCADPPTVGLTLRPPGRRSRSDRLTVNVHVGGGDRGVEDILQERARYGRRWTGWRTIARGGGGLRDRVVVRRGVTYGFRAQATNALGLVSPWETRTVRLPRRRPARRRARRR
ncbi:alkaline phosphatase family protein [Conexibacter sp. DBS9H8]|uniref:alkaline phosphatase family protein n=1 Tax=Conexibacter sp. DBS9H8 TaxID=2937801 RepID=UPI00200F8E3F|nr:alkaline phosphatase family protein [Conexibacter sp. DBS9H8]